MKNDKSEKEKMDEPNKHQYSRLTGGSIFGDDLLTPEERPRGILSKVDREFLCGNKQYEHSQSEANRRQDIRKRVSNSFQDFVLLAFLLSEEEREQITQQKDPEDLDIELSAMISFIYLCVDQDKDHLENIIETGVLWGANDHQEKRWSGEAIEVDTSIDVTYAPNIDQIYSKFTKDDGNGLTPAEIGVLVQRGKLTAEDLNQLEITRRDPFDRNQS